MSQSHSGWMFCLRFFCLCDEKGIYLNSLRIWYNIGGRRRRQFTPATGESMYLLLITDIVLIWQEVVTSRSRLRQEKTGILYILRIWYCIGRGREKLIIPLPFFFHCFGDRNSKTSPPLASLPLGSIVDHGRCHNHNPTFIKSDVLDSVSLSRHCSLLRISSRTTQRHAAFGLSLFAHVLTLPS